MYITVLTTTIIEKTAITISENGDDNNIEFVRRIRNREIVFVSERILVFLLTRSLVSPDL